MAVLLLPSPPPPPRLPTFNDATLQTQSRTFNIATQYHFPICFISVLLCTVSLVVITESILRQST